MVNDQHTSFQLSCYCYRIKVFYLFWENSGENQCTSKSQHNSMEKVSYMAVSIPLFKSHDANIVDFIRKGHAYNVVSFNFQKNFDKAHRINYVFLTTRRE